MWLSFSPPAHAEAYRLPENPPADIPWNPSPGTYHDPRIAAGTCATLPLALAAWASVDYLNNRDASLQATMSLALTPFAAGLGESYGNSPQRGLIVGLCGTAIDLSVVALYVRSNVFQVSCPLTAGRSCLQELDQERRNLEFGMTVVPVLYGIWAGFDAYRAAEASNEALPQPRPPLAPA